MTKFRWLMAAVTLLALVEVVRWDTGLEGAVQGALLTGYWLCVALDVYLARQVAKLPRDKEVQR